ncbi:MAG TPA: hypothetical protein GXX29_11090 [Firmicutes bacterium]|nr:hypothetical protein [Bacillota bacterium]
MKNKRLADRRTEDQHLRQLFPDNPHLQKLLAKCTAMQVSLSRSLVPEQWLYHPGRRTIMVWEPDLTEQSLSFLVVILAHELGHAADFDAHPNKRRMIKHLHWASAPPSLEKAAFVRGFRLLMELSIPVSLDDYIMMIEPPMAEKVRAEIEENLLCCLLRPAAGLGKNA